MSAHLVEHVALTTRKASPVGKHNQRQSFVVDVLDRLSRLVGAVRVPNATGLVLGMLGQIQPTRVFGQQGGGTTAVAAVGGRESAQLLA